MAWMVAYKGIYKGKEKQENIVVYRPDDVEHLQQTKPAWCSSVEVRKMKPEELRRPDDGEDVSM